MILFSANMAQGTKGYFGQCNILKSIIVYVRSELIIAIIIIIKIIITNN